MDYIIRKPTDLNAPSTNAIIDAPKHLSFVTDAKTQEHLKAASATIEALSKNSDCGIVHFDEYGSDYVKKVGTFSFAVSFQLFEIALIQCLHFLLNGSTHATLISYSATRAIIY